MPYNRFSTYLREKYQGKVRKICIDGGFSCPNRDGTCGEGGCIFCGERGAGEHIDSTLSIKEQAEAGLDRLKDGERAIIYFQNFTNTYASVEVLKERYDAALIDPRIVALAVGTRPDCISEDVVDLLAEYQKRLDVWVELGLQTASDRTAAVINRGYKTERFLEAVNLLKSRDVPIVAHMIIGLPDETEEDIDYTIDLLNSVPIWGVKIHSLYVMSGTRLTLMYESGEFTPLGVEKYIELCARAISRLRPDIVIHRLTGDCPEGMLVAPKWPLSKSEIISKVIKRLVSEGLRQGSLYLEGEKP